MCGLALHTSDKWFNINGLCFQKNLYPPTLRDCYNLYEIAECSRLHGCSGEKLLLPFTNTAKDKEWVNMAVRIRKKLLLARSCQGIICRSKIKGPSNCTYQCGNFYWEIRNRSNKLTGGGKDTPRLPCGCRLEKSSIQIVDWLELSGKHSASCSQARPIRGTSTWPNATPVSRDYAFG